MKIVNQGKTEEYYQGYQERPMRSFKWLDCKKCRYCKMSGKWKHCKMGMGTFPNNSKILECKFYEEKE